MTKSHLKHKLRYRIYVLLSITFSHVQFKRELAPIRVHVHCMSVNTSKRAMLFAIEKNHTYCFNIHIIHNMIHKRTIGRTCWFCDRRMLYSMIYLHCLRVVLNTGNVYMYMYSISWLRASVCTYEFLKILKTWTQDRALGSVSLENTYTSSTHVWAS